MDTTTSDKKNGPRTILYIDDGVSFGGALMVTSVLTRYLDPERYRAVIVSEVGGELLEHLFGDRATCHVVRRVLNYTHWQRIRQVLRRLPFAWLRSAANLAITFLAGLLNTPYFLRVAWIAHRERADVIHHSNGATHLFFTLLGRPHMATMAGIKSSPYNRFQKLAMSRMRKFVMISQAALDGYLVKGGRAEIAEIVPNPCDPQEISAEAREDVRRRYGIAPDEKVFGIIGRIVGWKGQKEFMHAAVQVLDSLPGARALLAGSATDDGQEYLAEVREIAERSSHSDRILFLGYVKDVHEVYNILDVTVHASIVPEPFGLVIIESMGYGVPIVAADLGGPREIIEDGVDGFLVDPANAREMAGRILQLLEDPALRQRLGAAGRAKVELRYGAKRYAERIQSIYDDLCGV